MYARSVSSKFMPQRRNWEELDEDTQLVMNIFKEDKNTMEMRPDYAL